MEWMLTEVAESFHERCANAPVGPARATSTAIQPGLKQLVLDCKCFGLYPVSKQDLIWNYSGVPNCNWGVCFLNRPLKSHLPAVYLKRDNSNRGFSPSLMTTRVTDPFAAKAVPRLDESRFSYRVWVCWYGWTTSPSSPKAAVWNVIQSVPRVNPRSVFSICSPSAGRHYILTVSLESPTIIDSFRELYILGCMCSPTIHHYTSPLPP